MRVVTSSSHSASVMMSGGDSGLTQIRDKALSLEDTSEGQTLELTLELGAEGGARETRGAPLSSPAT